MKWWLVTIRRGRQWTKTFVTVFLRSGDVNIELSVLCGTSLAKLMNLLFGCHASLRFLVCCDFVVGSWRLYDFTVIESWAELGSQVQSLLHQPA